MNLSAQHHPIKDIEAAHEAAEILLNDHKSFLPAELVVLLDTFRSDLAVLIEDYYGMGDDDEDARAAAFPASG